MPEQWILPPLLFWSGVALTVAAFGGIGMAGAFLLLGAIAIAVAEEVYHV